jgi:DNA-binding response OmpR family regulator
MTNKRVLLIHADPLLANLLVDKLERESFVVEVATNGEAALAVAAKRRPDAVVTDSVLPGTEIGQLVGQIHAQFGRPLVPIVVLPGSRAIFAEAAQQSGAIVLKRGVNPVAEIIDALQGSLAMEKTNTQHKGLVFRPEENWLTLAIGSAPDTLTSLRRSLHELSREGGSLAAAQEFFHSIHGLSEEMAILGQRPLHYFAAQMEGLAFDIFKHPEQINPSILRTLSQAVDFFATLLPEAARLHLKDPTTAQVLVVDDEEGARKIIMAAMRMANLKSMAADTPSTSLSALGVQGFDLIFLDVGLPEMNGFELCAKIRALPLHEKTPIIFITGMATFQNRVQSSLSGGNDFVGKPFNISELGLKALIWVFKGQLGLI